jgi:hypothetical protein
MAVVASSLWLGGLVDGAFPSLVEEVDNLIDFEHSSKYSQWREVESRKVLFRHRDFLLCPLSYW